MHEHAFIHDFIKDAREVPLVTYKIDELVPSRIGIAEFGENSSHIYYLSGLVWGTFAKMFPIGSVAGTVCPVTPGMKQTYSQMTLATRCLMEPVMTPDGVTAYVLTLRGEAVRAAIPDPPKRSRKKVAPASPIAQGQTP